MTDISPDSIDTAVLDRYLAGDCLPEERDAVEAWLAADPLHARLLIPLEKMTSVPGVTAQSAGHDPDSAWAQFSARHVVPGPDRVWPRDPFILEDRSLSHRGQTMYGSRVKPGMTYLSGMTYLAGVTGSRFVQRVIAASAIAMVVVLGVLYRNDIKTLYPSSPEAVAQMYTTQPGQRLRLELDDGSRVILGPETEITVRGRTVDLRGRALFTVTHHGADPFIVRSGTTTTKVLGTVFGVQAYSEDSTVQVVVAEGRVAVNETVVSNGDIATVSGRGVDLGHDAERVAAWTAFAQGKLVLDAAELGDVAPEIGRWLGITVRVMPTAAGKKMTVVLRDESVQDGLELIAALTNTQVQRDGDVVTFDVR